MKRKLDSEMIKFLDERTGKSLVLSIHEFRNRFSLSVNDTHRLYVEWVVIPVNKAKGES